MCSWWLQSFSWGALSFGTYSNSSTLADLVCCDVCILTFVLHVCSFNFSLLAFPGSSSRVPAEIETEFARYSVRMVQTAATCIIDLCSALLSTSAPARKSHHSLTYYDVPGLWTRAQSYRDRVLGMYLDVLAYLYREPGSQEVSANGTPTRYGNNPISGDIGNLMGLTVSHTAIHKCLLLLVSLTQVFVLYLRRKPDPTGRP